MIDGETGERTIHTLVKSQDEVGETTRWAFFSRLASVKYSADDVASKKHFVVRLTHGRDTSTEACGLTLGGRLTEQITGEPPRQFHDSCDSGT